MASLSSSGKDRLWNGLFFWRQVPQKISYKWVLLKVKDLLSGPRELPWQCALDSLVIPSVRLSCWTSTGSSSQGPRSVYPKGRSRNNLVSQWPGEFRPTVRLTVLSRRSQNEKPLSKTQEDGCTKESRSRSRPDLTPKLASVEGSCCHLLRGLFSWLFLSQQEMSFCVLAKTLLFALGLGTWPSPQLTGQSTAVVGELGNLGRTCRKPDLGRCFPGEELDSGVTSQSCIKPRRKIPTVAMELSDWRLCVRDVVFPIYLLIENSHVCEPSLCIAWK